MKICLITDEVSGDPETAFELGVEGACVDFEIRDTDSTVSLFHPYQKQRLKELLEEFSVRIVVVSPGSLKSLTLWVHAPNLACKPSISSFTSVGRMRMIW
jgi:hypothetical protein